MNYINEIDNLIKQNNGMLFTADLTKYKIPRTYLSKLVTDGKLERVNRGVYVSSGFIEDEMYYMQIKYPKIIYSHETALYMHGLSDRTPFEYSITVPSGYKAVENLAANNKLYFIKAEAHMMGVSEMKTSFGNVVRAYNVERTICDMIRSRSRMDIQIFNDALRRYAKLKTADFVLLGEYAKVFHVDKVLKRYIEVLV